MLRPRRRRLRSLSLTSMIPNMMTVIALCSGLTSIRFGLAGEWALAAGAIVFAGVLDGLDGRLARALNSSTRFGAELDSLSDFVSFGVAPVVLLYQWSLSGLGGIGWIVVLGYSVCCALRLARFNTGLPNPTEARWAAEFFEGAPAPGAAGLALLPVFLSLQFGDGEPRWAPLVAIYVLALSALMVSRVPTMSFKTIRIERDYVLVVLLVVALAVAAVSSYPWLTLVVISVAYFFTIPIGLLRYRKLSRLNAVLANGDGVPADEASDLKSNTDSDAGVTP
jgi:CDP-diacylglycerol--serine O-phosphatidyltransferase